MTDSIPPHPAKWSQAVLDEIAAITFELLPDKPVNVFDPFAGIGATRLGAAIGQTVQGVELEAEWADQDEDTVVGNALALPFPDGSQDVLITSPAYGTRMADHHEAKDKCKACGGRGTNVTGERHMGGTVDPILQPCKACKGSGLSKRNTYTHTLGRPLSEDSTADKQWGPAYRALHEAAWKEALRVLKPGGLVILNASNHIRDGRERHVAEWHLNAFLLLGCRLWEVRRVRTPRNGFGANRDARVDGELVMVLHTPTP